MDGPVMLGVLGGMVFERGGVRVPLGGPKAQQLLSVLCSNPDRPISTDRLVDTLWPDRPPASPSAVVHSQISRLRTVLGPEITIRREVDGYRLVVPPEALDSVHFEQLLTRSRSVEPRAAVPLLDEALTLWRGPAFGEHAGIDALRAEAVRLDELRLVAIDEWAAARLECGDAASMVGELEALVERHPFRERFWVLLMLSLSRTGRQAEALRRADQLRTLLRDEAGLELPQNVRQLEARILADDPGLDHRPDHRLDRDDVGLVAAGVDGPGSTSVARLLGSTSFVGREPDVQQLLDALREHRLVTVTGPGGVGKTRVAMRAAGLFAGELDGDITVVELSALRDASGLADVVAHALDIQRRQSRSLEATIEEYLSSRSALVLLDNCEHVIDAVAALVDRLRASCLGLKILVTSRQPLALAGEYVAILAPLSLPSTGVVSLEEAQRSDAVRLFVSRASVSTPGFVLTSDNVAAVVGICRRLDGLPLGLELAAARLRTLGVGALAERLERRVQSLGHPPRAGEQRQRTLTDLMRWSYDLLDASAQRLFDQLAVFAGGFDLAAVEAVCADRPSGDVVEGSDGRRDSLDTLADLVEQSMVNLVDPQVPRYRLLEPLREFAQDRLLDGGDMGSVEARHVGWFVQLAERGAAGLDTPDEGVWSAALDLDIDNFRAAHRCAMRTGDLDGTLRLVSALREFGFRRVQYEVTSWAQEASELPGAHLHPDYPTMLAMRAYGHWVRGDIDASMTLSHQSLDAQAASGGSGSGLAERVLGNALFYLGRSDEAIVWMDRMLTSARAAGDAGRRTHALYMQSIAQTSIGNTVRGAIMAGEVRAAAELVGSPTALAQADYALGLALEGSDPTEAFAHLEHAARRGGAAGNRWIEAFALTEVHWLRARRGEHLAGLSGFADVVTTWYRGGDWANQWLSLRRVFGVLVDLGEFEEAAVLYGALSAVGAAHALPFEPADADRLAAIVDDLRSLLGDTGFAVAVRRGTSMTDSEIVASVIGHIAAVTSGDESKGMVR